MRLLFFITLTFISLYPLRCLAETNFKQTLSEITSESNENKRDSLINYYMREVVSLHPSIAIESLNILLENINKENLPHQYIRLNQEIAIQQNLAGNDEKSLQILFNLLEFVSKKELERFKPNIYTDIGWVFYFKDDCPSALIYFKKSYNLKISLKDSIDLGGSFSNIGTCYSKINEFDSAELYIQKAKNFYLNNKDSSNLAKVYNNLGNFYFRNKSDLDLAEHNFNKALDIYSIRKDTRNQAITIANLGNLKITQNDKEDGGKLLKEALFIANSISFPALKRYALSSLKDYYVQETQFDSAFYYQKKLYQFNDSLDIVDQQKAIEEIEARYKFKEQVQNIAIKDLKINQLVALSIVLFLILIILFLLVFYFRQRKIVKEELEKVKSDFFSKIAHEFKTPLSLVIAPLEEMLEQPKNDIDYTKLALATKNAHQVSHLINQLLDVAKLEEKRMPLIKSYGDIVIFIEEIVENYKVLATERGVDIEFKTTIDEFFLKFDSDKIKKVIENILSNAIKYTQPNSTVKVNMETDDKHLIIRIKDQGAGLSQEEIKSIFDKFYRTKSSEESKSAGTGLGLSLAKDLIELHGGEISVSSKIGEGSCFSIFIPIESKDELVLEKDFIEKTNQEIEILIVEDNEPIRNYLKQIFTSINIKVSEAINGKEGLQLATEKIPDIIISDLMMPEMNGIQMVKNLKSQEITNHIPIIMLTAKSSVESRLEGLKAEADVYLSKPFVVKELINHIYNFLSLREKIRQNTLSKSFEETEKNKNLLEIEDKFIQKIIQIVLSELDNEQLSVETISSLLHLSRTQVHRKVKAVTGVSISVLVRNIRLEKALEFLKNKEGNVSEIAYKTGFNSASYFSTCFTEYFGFPPTKLP